MQARIRISWKQISAELLKPGTSQDNLDTSAMLALGVPLTVLETGGRRAGDARAGGPQREGAMAARRCAGCAGSVEP